MDIFSERVGALRDISPPVLLDMCPALLQQTLLYQLHRSHTYYHSEHKTSTLNTVPTVHVPFTSSTVNYSNTDSWSGNVTTAEKITRFKGMFCIITKLLNRPFKRSLHTAVCPCPIV